MQRYSFVKLALRALRGNTGGQPAWREPQLKAGVRPNLQLVGLASDTDIVVGSHLPVADSDEPWDGWVSSAGRGAFTGEPIALALLRGGRQRLGEHVSVHDMGRVTRARVTRRSSIHPESA